MKIQYNWKERREKKAKLVLEDGSIFKGYSFGASVDSLGEVVFNTGMSGYQEIITDPSYAGQFITMTYPEIGNTGINLSDNESEECHLQGFIVNEINDPSNWRSQGNLQDLFKSKGIPAIAGIDTRALTTVLREKGSMKGYLNCSENILSNNECREKTILWCGLDDQDYAAKVTCKKEYKWDPNDSKTISWGITDRLPPANLNVVAYDFGIKWNILRSLRLNCINVLVVPANTTAEDVMKLKPDGVFFSNGPADPSAVTYAVDSAKKLIGKVPIMGICLGHQILSIACGAKTYRLKFGHHGCNHPVKNLLTGKIEITSQNHNYAVSADSIANSELVITHMNLNDNTIEGIRHKTAPLFAVQYHPEASPGPHDPAYLFAEFNKMIKESKI